MPFVAIPDVPPIIRHVDEFVLGERPVSGSEDFWKGHFDVNIRCQIDEICVGETRYPLRNSLQGFFLPDRDRGGGEFRVHMLPAIVVHGSDIADALKNWKDQLHTEFQKLISKRPFEMSSSERAMWQMLSDRIDIAQYRNIHLVKLRQLGRVEDARPGHNRIAWENGDSHRVRLDEMPAEFATYKPGQPFEAIVVYHPRSMRFMKVEYVSRTATAPRLSDTQRQGIWDSMRTSSELPDADWDSSN